MKKTQAQHYGEALSAKACNLRMAVARDYYQPIKQAPRVTAAPGKQRDNVRSERDKLRTVNTELLAALREINDAIYACGAPLGSPVYFRVRTICCDILYSQQKSAR